MFLVSQFRNGIIINSLPSNVEQEFEMLLRKAIPMQDTGSMHIQNTGQSNGSLHIQNTGQSNASNPARVTVQPILPPLNSVQQQQQQLNWIITPQEKAKYDQILISAVDNQGYISASQAKQIFAQSGLRENMLRHIWDLADMNRRGKLNSDEFAVAMYLIYAKLGGRDLPRELPQELVPPSQRELSMLK